jgi:hypothetical protein
MGKGTVALALADVMNDECRSVWDLDGVGFRVEVNSTAPVEKMNGDRIGFEVGLMGGLVGTPYTPTNKLLTAKSGFWCTVEVNREAGCFVSNVELLLVEDTLEGELIAFGFGLVDLTAD